MEIPPFALERIQSLWEHVVDYNLSESGVHPLSLAELLDGDPGAFAEFRLGYTQTNGTPALRERIAALYPNATSEQVLVTNGTSEANFIAIWSLLEPGDELALMLPNYMQLWGLGQVFGGAVRPFHLRAERDWAPGLDELRHQITPRTRLVAVCNPNNPTGAVLDEGEIRQIVEAAARVGAWVLADEVYQGAEREGARTRSFRELCADYERIIITNGLSKAYGLPGLRIGWVIGPQALVAQLWSSHDYTTIAPGALSDRLAQVALDRREWIFARTRRLLRENFELVAQWVRAQEGRFEVNAPRAGAIALLRHHLPLSSIALVEGLRQRRGVLLVPGEHFDLPGYLRLGFGGERDYLEAGLERISSLVREEF
jgi:aspartate/methionine/tyrosine aminotransferase